MHYRHSKKQSHQIEEDKKQKIIQWMQQIKNVLVYFYLTHLFALPSTLGYSFFNEKDHNPLHKKIKSFQIQNDLLLIDLNKQFIYQNSFTGFVDRTDNLKILENLNKKNTKSKKKLFQETKKRQKILEKVTYKLDEPLFILNQLVKKKQHTLEPYIPFLTSIYLCSDLTKIIRGVYNDFSLGFLFKKYVETNVGFGYKYSFRKEKIIAELEGWYTYLGLRYMMIYDKRNNIYGGIKNTFSVTNVFYKDTNNIKEFMLIIFPTLVLGTEIKIPPKAPFYIGTLFEVRQLFNFKKIEARNQNEFAIKYVPGYGNPIHGSTLIFLNIYLKYYISFLEEYIT